MPIKRNELNQFYGTEQWYTSSMGAFLYTDGIKYLIDNGASWVIDVFISYIPRVRKINDYFFTINLEVNTDKSCVFKIEDGNGNIYIKQEIEYTDFPLSNLKLFFVDNVLMLSSEY